MEKGTNCYEPEDDDDCCHPTEAEWAEENLRKSEDGNVEDKDSNMFSGS
jgi:hypothetical protein|tara:strand:- start:6561 stop:6707 length:147 start_codon:yes stop_codon:yes gene_type:complete